MSAEDNEYMGDKVFPTKESALDWLDNYLSLDERNNLIRALEQEPKIGRWIELGRVGNDNYDFECSECHHTDTHSKTVKVNYCWCCGAKMLAESDE